MTRAIGIDLGTTYTCAAAVQGGKPQVIRSSLGYTTIPSIVAFDDKGEPVVGQRAERNMILSPSNTIYGSKRLLGRAFLPGVIERFQPHFEYALVAGEDGFVAAQIAGRVVPLVTVSALILREMRRAAIEGLGETVDRAVVTVPAYFNENQRALVREAGKQADLEIIRIINEPTAAALCFGLNRGEKKRLLVFDLGGGTFDVSIIELDGNVFNVLATDGDTFLGGLDFDQRIVDLLIDQAAKRLDKPINLDPVSRQRLRLAAQEAKHLLSVQERTIVSLSRVGLADDLPIDLHSSLGRPEFEELTRDLVDRTMVVVDRALEAAELTPKHIDEVLLVGGQSRMPVVHRRLREKFGKEPSKRVHPDEVVGLGAAIAADSHERFDLAVIKDVAPLPIGISEADGTFRQIIGRNTPVPHTAVATVTVWPANTALKLSVFQGGRARARENEYLGTLIVDQIPPADGPRECQLTFALDAECLLKIRATVSETSIDREVTLATQQTPDHVLEEMGAERVRTARPAQPPPVPRRAALPAKLAAGGTAAPVGRGIFGRLFGWLRR